MSYEKNRLDKNIQYKIKEEGLIKNVVEKKCRVSEGYLGRRESKYDLHLLCDLARMFKVSIDELIYCDLSLNTNNLKRLCEYIDKLIEETEVGKISWKISRDFSILRNAHEDSFMYDEMDKTYHRYFQDNCECGEIVGNVYVADGNEELVLINVRAGDEEGWELYKMKYTGGYNEYEYRPMGIYHTFSENGIRLLHKTQDLVKSIKLSKMDFNIVPRAEDIIRGYLSGKKIEVSLYRYCSLEDCEDDFLN